MEAPGTEELTEEEKRVLRLLAKGHTVEIAAELMISPDSVTEHVQSITVKLGDLSRLDPPPLPPAASAALAVPFQRAEDIPRHVGRHVHRMPSRHST